MSGDGEEEGDCSGWGAMTPEQKEYFKKLTEKSDENMRYIG